jgi:hypothetical protein
LVVGPREVLAGLSEDGESPLVVDGERVERRRRSDDPRLQGAARCDRTGGP